ncbi:hypothetical protein IQ255_16720 [Pleurocapsales cyanobacterium LEGE 10410]|nr:hypothetical protein [Pleurocapsales cyanobacterium LEGE 10410]
MPKYSLFINKSSALLLSLVTVFAFAEDRSVRAQEVEGNTTIEEVTEEEVVVGEEVTVRGEIEEVDPGISFTLQEEGFLEGDEVLVINTSETIVPEGMEDMGLQVTGELGTFILADVETEYGLDLDPDLYVDYESQPVIFAEYMVLSPELDEVSENPENYYDLEIALEGEIDEIRNDYTFTLKEEQLIGGENLLIINATGEPIPADDETVVVTGMVRPYIKAEFERDYDLDWDLDVQEEIEAEYTERPVLVVDSIYAAAEDDGFLD